MKTFRCGIWWVTEDDSGKEVYRGRTRPTGQTLEVEVTDDKPKKRAPRKRAPAKPDSGV